MAYVTTKCIKRMETYRSRISYRTETKKILLPLSFGPGSTSLLYILDQQLQAQRARMGRTSYELTIVNLISSPDDLPYAESLVEKFKSLFPTHTYLIAPLSQAISLSSIDWSIFNLSEINTATKAPSQGTLQTLLSDLPSPTARADVLNTLQTHLLVDIAHTHSCSSILFAHSTTRLAERVLISTASGRGFSLPWQVRDGPSPYGVDFAYPMRDLLGKEIVAFAQSEEKLAGLVTFDGKVEVSASAKNTTIDDLMKAYFASVEENYPSIVANVVRTSSKLESSDTKTSDRACGLCGLPVEEGSDGIYGWGGDQRVNAREENIVSTSTQHEEPKKSILCYGCSRSVNG